MSTFAQLQTLTAERCGIASSDAAIGTANTGALASLVRAALRRLDTKPPSGWNWQRVTGNFPTVAGTEQYTFAALATALGVPTVRKIVEIRCGLPASGIQGQWPVKRVARQEADGLYPETAQQQPQVYWTEGLAVGLRPVPDGIYTIRATVIRGETELTAGTDLPIMPVEYHDAIVEQAAELWYRARHNLPDAQAAAGAVTEWVKTMTAGQRPYTGAGRVTVEGDGIA